MERISSDEFTEYKAYHHLDPWGTDRDDLLMAIQTAYLLNIQIQKRSDKVSPADLIPKFFDEDESLTNPPDPVEKAFRNALVKYEALDGVIDNREKTEAE